MYIVNKTDSDAYWQTFNAGDISRTVGLGDGILKPGEYVTWWLGKSKEDKVQLRVKKNGPSGPLIQKPSTGELFRMEDEVAITAEGVVRIGYDTTP